MTLLQHLNKVSEERGYMDFHEATESCWRNELEEIIQESGNRFKNEK